jgi:hypothetical protein
VSRLGSLRLQAPLEVRSAFGLDEQHLAIGVEHFLGRVLGSAASA